MSKEKLHHILLLGPEMPFDEKIKKLYFEEDGKTPKPGCLIIGDGKNKIKKSDIELLKGEMDHGTRIDIIAHGGLTDKGLFGTQHTLSLVEGADKTSEVFKILAEASGEVGRSDQKSLEVHVFSCYAGLAAREASQFRRGTVVAGHGSETKTTVVNLNKDGLLASVQSSMARKAIPKTDPATSIMDAIDIMLGKNKPQEQIQSQQPPGLNINNVIDDIHLGSEQKCFVGVSGLTGSVGFRIPSKELVSLDSIRSRILDFKSRIFDKVASVDNFALPGIKFDKNSKEVKMPDDKKLKDFQHQSLFFRMFQGKSEIKKLVSTNAEDLKKIELHKPEKQFSVAALANKKYGLLESLISKGFEKISATDMDDYGKGLSEKQREEYSSASLERTESIFSRAVSQITSLFRRESSSDKPVPEIPRDTVAVSSTPISKSIVESPAHEVTYDPTRERVSNFVNKMRAGFGSIHSRSTISSQPRTTPSVPGVGAARSESSGQSR